ncbi:MAG: NADH-quinone oxidoreductase subunit C [Desulfurococcaceae archaeon]
MEALSELLKEYALTTYSMKPNRLVIEIPRERVKDALKAIKEKYGDTGIYVSTIVGTDFPDKKQVRLDYYLVTHPDDNVYVLRTWLPREDPRVDSILDLFPGALSGECETHDLLGVVFEGNPFIKRGFFVPTDITSKGVFPLRKDSGV